MTFLSRTTLFCCLQLPGTRMRLLTSPHGDEWFYRGSGKARHQMSLQPGHRIFIYDNFDIYIEWNKNAMLLLCNNTELCGGSGCSKTLSGHQHFNLKDKLDRGSNPRRVCIHKVAFIEQKRGYFRRWSHVSTLIVITVLLLSCLPPGLHNLFSPLGSVIEWIQLFVVFLASKKKKQK